MPANTDKGEILKILFMGLLGCFSNSAMQQKKERILGKWGKSMACGTNEGSPHK